jgi:lipoprotein-anchoring transpeptidase ErfK/SrfK
MRRQKRNRELHKLNVRLRQAVVVAATLAIAAARARAQAPHQSLQDSVASPARQQARRIVVSIPDRKLALVEDGRVVKIYSVAVGRPSSPSPTGHFTIVERIANPGYYAPGVIVQPGTGNPLGTRWIGLSANKYGIHGTNKPRSIGHFASHGCIRLRNADAEDLFDRVRAGDAVELVRERNVETARLFSGVQLSEPQSEQVIPIAQIPSPATSGPASGVSAERVEVASLKGTSGV